MPPQFADARIAILAPITYQLPPPGYGPWEQVAYNVAEGLRSRGADVTLFATANSRYAGLMRSVVPVGLAEDRGLDAEVYTGLHIANLFARASEFDLIHSHLDWRPLLHALSTSSPPMVTTIHGFSSPQTLAAYYAASNRCFYCSISNADRDPGLPYVATVYHGIDLAQFTYRGTPDDYLLFFGRIHEEKGPHVAIEVARKTGRRLILAGIVHDDDYYRESIAPHVDGDRIRFVGEIRGRERDALMGGASALLQLNTRPERFGLSMIEAMACGTPVIGAALGSIPEVVDDGVTGFICADVDEAARAVAQIGSVSRAACRAHVERRFTIDRMVDGYLEAYARVLQQRAPTVDEAHAAAQRRDWWDRPMAFTDVPTRPWSLPIA